MTWSNILYMLCIAMLANTIFNKVFGPQKPEQMFDLSSGKMPD